MSKDNMYLITILNKYSPRDLANYSNLIYYLKAKLKTWANGCYIDVFDSGSRAKGTAISIASDVDYLISLTNSCNENSGGLASIYDSLYRSLNNDYTNVRKQNVSVRINLHGLEVDITPARKQLGNTNDHSLWVSKLNTWKKTNIKKHINDILNSKRTNEIKLLKIWRELNKLDFPSIYLEYLLKNHILLYKPIGIEHLAENLWHVLLELAKTDNNPLLLRVIDPANSSNILSDLLTKDEKSKIYLAARNSTAKKYWSEVIW